MRDDLEFEYDDDFHQGYVECEMGLALDACLDLTKSWRKEARHETMTAEGVEELVN